MFLPQCVSAHRKISEICGSLFYLSFYLFYVMMQHRTLRSHSKGFWFGLLKLAFISRMPKYF